MANRECCYTLSKEASPINLGTFWIEALDTQF